MRWIYLFLIGGLLWSGCATQKGSTTGPAKSKTARKGTTSTTAASGAPKATNAVSSAKSSLSVTNGSTVLTLTDAITGKVATVNMTSRFVILDYSLSRLPAVGERLNVYRQNLKVGEVKVTGPERNNNIAADLVAGEAQPGDVVRKD